MAKTLEEAIRDGDLDPATPSISCGNCGAVFQRVDADGGYDRDATYGVLAEHEPKCSAKRRFRSDANAVGYAY